MDGRPYRRNKAAFANFSGEVRTSPQALASGSAIAFFIFDNFSWHLASLYDRIRAVAKYIFHSINFRPRFLFPAENVHPPKRRRNTPGLR